MFDKYAGKKFNGIDVSIYSDGSLSFSTKHDDYIYFEETDIVYELIDWILMNQKELIGKQNYK